MASIWKNVHVDKLDNLVNEFNNNITYNRNLKMKPVDLNSSPYIEFNVEKKDKDPKFKVGDLVRIITYKIILAKNYTLNWSEKVFLLNWS